MREFLMPAAAALVVKLLFDRYIAAAVPDQVLVANVPILGIPITTDDVALSFSLGLAAPKVESFLRGAF